MKNLVNLILEGKNDKEAIIPSWVDFVAIDLNANVIEYYNVTDLHDSKKGFGDSVLEPKIEKLKVGESYFDEKDQCVYIMLIDQEALKEE